jgi:hypothetical protein
MSENYLATRFTCSWPWSTLVLLCDGRVVCGCADPYAKRVLGDARRDTMEAIWTGSAAQALRTDLNQGGATFCGDCPLKLPLAPDVAPPGRSLDVGRLPSRLYVECTAACNISCFQACCAPETGITRTRQAGMLDFEVFARVLDEVGPSLVRLDFFNYGETFLHKRAIEMCERIKTRFPHIYLYTSTNGLALDPEKTRRLARSGIDEVTFSIDGATQASYERYRQRGNLERALTNLATLVAEKQRTGSDVPFINWRYILFTWNDSDEEMNLARRLAEEIGVDRLCWEMTDHPPEAFSRRFAPGTEGLARIRHEVWDDNGLGNAIAGGTPRARIELCAPEAGRLIARAGETLVLDTRVRNLSARPFPASASQGRRLVRLGAQLCRTDGSLVDRNLARAPLPRTLDPGATEALRISVAAPATPGDYLLKFDLVCEGIDWFEAAGSPVTTTPLTILA